MGTLPVNGSVQNGTLITNGYMDGNTFVVLPNPIEYYDNDLVPSWNRGKPKFMLFLNSILKPLNDLYAILDSYYNQPEEMGLQYAVGKQLDFIGQIVGCGRVLPVAFSGLSRTLNDDDYRYLIKAKIAQNYWDGTLEGFDNIIKTLFPNFDAQVIDNQDGSVQIKLSSTTRITPVQMQMLLNGLLLPYAAGVKMTVNVASQFAAAQVGLKTGVYTIGVNKYSTAE